MDFSEKNRLENEKCFGHQPEKNIHSPNLEKNMFLNRRTFIGLGLLGLTGLITGCMGRTALKGNLKNVAEGFDVYTKMNPNLKSPHSTWGTWYDQLKQWGYLHTGETYNLPWNEPIVASASGYVIGAFKKIGSGLDTTKSSGDCVEILHGTKFREYITRYYHMKVNSRTVKSGQTVKRGQIIGYPGAPHNMHFKHVLLVYFSREQPNNFGKNMEFMDYWDEETNLDIKPEKVYSKSMTQSKLIYKFLRNYKGVNDLNFDTMMHKGNWSWENREWSPIERFKLGKFIYDRHPDLFDGTKDLNDSLISGIYENQPIILTLPMKKPT